MKKAIEKFCKKNEKGLFLLDMPTGSGKTFNVLEFIAENYDKDDFKDKKIFFITTLKKNLPYSELYEKFKNRGKGDNFNNISLRIEANADAVINNLIPLYKEIPEKIKQKDEFRELWQDVKLLNEYKDKKKSKKDEAIINLCNVVEKNINDKLEREFREVVVNELSQFNTPKEKLTKIIRDKEYHWIGKLYPAVYTKVRQIYFMSMDKFILGNTTLIEPTYNFYNNEIIDNAIIFIDEFDSTKDRILNQIIRKGLDNHIDYLTLFTQIDSSLRIRSFPTELTTDSVKQQEYLKQNKKAKTSKEIIDGFEEVFDKTYKRFNMQYSFKTKDADREASRNFIFNDLIFHSIFSGNKAFMQVKTDKKARQNWLEIKEERPKDEDMSVLAMLADVKGAISYFQNGVGFLSRNYKELQYERKKQNEDDFTFENAVASVLKEFHLSSDNRRYLQPIILFGNKINKKSNRNKDNKLSLKALDLSVYDKGFRYYDFIDNPNHNMQSEIQLYDFQDSPEKILLRVAERARVVGISATATIDTVIGNYDLEYLRRMLQDLYYELPDEDEKRLRDSFNGFIAGYDNVNIHVEHISSKDDYEEVLQGIFSSPTLIKHYSEKLEIIFSDKDNFAASSFLKVIKVMKHFIYNENIRSFLCLTNKLVRKNNKFYNLEIIKDFAKSIIKEAGLEKELNANNFIVSINSADYDAQYNDMIKRLSKGEKLFVLSSYNTIGAGQNLQYKKPENIEVVKVTEHTDRSNKKDFDGIYLEKPTNLLVNIIADNKITEEDFIRFIFQIEFLMERGELSRKVGISYIKNAFIKYSSGFPQTRNVSEAYKTHSINNYAIRILQQAVGRICRTGLKNKNIYIYIDEEIYKKYDLSKVENRLLNPEFKKIIEYGKKYKINVNQSSENLSRLENLASNISLKMMTNIDSFRRDWNTENIEYWKKLRELCLMRPTMSQREIDENKNKGYEIIYLEAPYKISKYSYLQENDYHKNIIVKFDDSLKQKMSEEDVHLQELFNIQGLKDYFKAMKYATEFTPNKYLLPPPIYNNIYKGALGETVGKYIFENYLDINLRELPDDLFELFDYVIGDGIYLDFKLWKPSMNVDAETEKKKILEKLEKCGGKRALIINIMLDRDAQIISSGAGKIVEVPYLYRTDLQQLETNMIKQIRRYFIEELYYDE